MLKPGLFIFFLAAIDYVIGHMEYTNFEGHALWMEVDEGYRTEKIDPDMDFIDKIRKTTSSYHWKSVPNK